MSIPKSKSGKSAIVVKSQGCLKTHYSLVFCLQVKGLIMVNLWIWMLESRYHQTSGTVSSTRIPHMHLVILIGMVLQSLNAVLANS
jgi:hypothetical protein